MTVFIGDVHGKYTQYKRILDHCEKSIQVGDMGVGFFNYRTGGPVANPPHSVMKEGGHRFIRGNHDNPTVCRQHSQCIPDGTVEGGTMYIGGAVSIDKPFRVEGFSWWKDEELSQEELGALIEKYMDVKPEIMVTHDCPEEVANAMCVHVGFQKIEIPSRTRIALQQMWNAHSPKLWVYGHWHFSFDHMLRGTRFVCLAELEAKEINLEELK